ncbi:MAG TPA: choice-of-anchor Q domain-containing protein [Phototrophicaceae bacterium]|nr:choice-of-anchor Q domain-containing protein [Phototrophicaceae bacterium]
MSWLKRALILGVWVLIAVVIFPLTAVQAGGVVTNCTEAGLRAALVGGGTVTFNCGTATIAITSQLEISQNTTIDGGGTITFDGGNRTRIINHTSNDLTVRNLTLTNARATGASAAANGAAIRSAPYPNGSTLAVNNVTFTNNFSDLTSFSGNAYDYGGGAIFSIGGVVQVTGSTFMNNRADGGGAAIHVLQSSASVQNSTFANNSATGYTSSSQGGAILIDGLGGASGYFTIATSTFTNNTAYNSGGAIYVNLYEDSTTFSVNHSSFINNGVVGGGRAQGGAISGGSTTPGNATIIITDSLFSGNTAGVINGLHGSGGALNFAQKARVTIRNSTFFGNRAQGWLDRTGQKGGSYGGALYLISYNQPYYLTNNTFANNYAEWTGGAIAADGNGVAINNLFYNNTADNGGNGWGIMQHCAGQMGGDGNFNLQYPPKNPNPNYGNETVCVANILGGTTNVDPLLDSLGDNSSFTQVMALLPGSPAINAGNSGQCAHTAIGICDIGAFEFNGSTVPYPPTPTSPDYNETVVGSGASLNWSRPSYAAQYHVQVDNNTGFPSPSVDVMTADQSYTIGPLPPGDYNWRVQALNAGGQNSIWIERNFTLASPVNATIGLHNFNTLPILLTWSQIPWATGYIVQVSTSNTFAPLAVPEISANASTLAATIATLPNGVYYWRVGAKQGGDTAKTWSAAETFTVGVP